MNRQARHRIAPLVFAATMLAGCAVAVAPGRTGSPTLTPASAGPAYPAVPPAGVPPVVGQGALAVLPTSTDGAPMPVTAELGSGWLATMLVCSDPVHSLAVRVQVVPAEVVSPLPPADTALVLTIDIFDAETGAKLAAASTAPALGVRPPPVVDPATLVMWQLDPTTRAYRPLAASVDEPRRALSAWLPNDTSLVVALSIRPSATGHGNTVASSAVGASTPVTWSVPVPASQDVPAEAPPPARAAQEPRRAPLPARLAIPALGVHAPITPVGLEASGIMASPTEGHVIGWYELGPRPGELSNAVLAGHVDLNKRPGVFSRLRELAPGATIDVDTGLGIAYRYVVEEVRSYPAADAPTAEIFGGTPDATLTLITCGGQFDPARREYLERVVVRARGA